MPIDDDPFREKDTQKSENDENKPAPWEADSAEDEDEDVIELSDTFEDSDEEQILELEEAIDKVSEEMDVLELKEEAPAAFGTEDDIFDTASESAAEVEDDEEVLDLTLEVTEKSSSDDEILELDDLHEAPPVDSKDTVSEPAEPQAAVIEEDKEILELIEDIQATLEKDTEPPDTVPEPEALEIENGADDDQAAASTVSTDDLQESSDTGMKTEPAAPLNEIEENDAKTADEPLILGDEEPLESTDLSESDSEFVDHLGLDLTSEFSREIFGDDAVAAFAGIDPALLEKAIELVIQKMLAEKESPLMKAIMQAVKNAMKDTDE